MCLRRFVVEHNYETSRFCLFEAGNLFIPRKSPYLLGRFNIIDVQLQCGVEF